MRKVAALDPAASLNLLLTDGSRILGVTWGDPLSYLVDADGVVVASEPYDDDPRWVDVPDRHLLEVTLGRTSRRRHRDRTGELMPTTACPSTSTRVPSPTRWPSTSGRV